MEGLHDCTKNLIVWTVCADDLASIEFLSECIGVSTQTIINDLEPAMARGIIVHSNNNIRIGSELIKNQVLSQSNVGVVSGILHRLGKKHQKEGSYSKAISHYNKAIDGLKVHSLVDDPWDYHHQLLFDLSIDLATTHYNNGDYQVCDDITAVLEFKLHNRYERVSLRSLNVIKLLRLANFDKALGVGKEILSEFEITIPHLDNGEFDVLYEENRLFIESMLTQGSDVDSFVIVSDPETKKLFDIMYNMCLVCFISFPVLYPLVSSKLLRLMLEKNLKPEYPVVIQTGKGLETAYDVSCLEITLPSLLLRGNAIENCLEQVKQAQVLSNQPVGEVIDVLKTSFELLNSKRVISANMMQSLIKEPKRTPFPLCLRLVLKFMLGDEHDSQKSSAMNFINDILNFTKAVNEKIIMFPKCFYTDVYQNFFGSLLLLRAFRSILSYGCLSTDFLMDFIKQKLACNQKLLKNRCDNCPRYFLSKYLLIEAEICAYVRQDDLLALAFYNESIKEANKQCLTHEEGIAYEMLSYYLIKKGDLISAEAKLFKAMQCYNKWEAHRKVMHIESLLNKLTSPIQGIDNFLV
ncbi:hypothetical protein AKO1_008064 [Acrasis kona]|uniref:Uncharacterized protein n=1 Tax=Acrasis kona TaxID=1008807 RepID=A0AAW2YQL8_9EUKA